MNDWYAERHTPGAKRTPKPAAAASSGVFAGADPMSYVYALSAVVCAAILMMFFLRRQQERVNEKDTSEGLIANL